MESIDVKVEGLHCENCVNRLTGVLSRSPGVESVKVSLKNGTASIVYDPTTASPLGLSGLIEDAGFRYQRARKASCTHHDGS